MGDMATVHSGPSTGFRGIVHSVDETHFWVTDSSQPLLDDLAVLRPFSRDLVTTSPPIHITWQPSHAFDVSVGDILQVVRGPLCGEVGLVESISPYESRVSLRIDASGTVCSSFQLFFLTCIDMMIL